MRRLRRAYVRWQGIGLVTRFCATLSRRLAGALLRRGAAVDATDESWGGTPLLWALYGWRTYPTAPAERYYEIVRTLLDAGAAVGPDMLAEEKVRADPTMSALLTRT